MDPVIDGEIGELMAACGSLLRSAGGLMLAGDATQRVEDLRQARQHVEEALALLGHDEAAAVGLGSLVSSLTDQILDGQAPPAPGPGGRRAAPTGERAGFEGYSTTLSLPDVLGFLRTQGKSGVLEAWAEDEVFTIELAKGELVHASSDGSPPQLRLGEILVAQGSIQRRRLETFLEHATLAGGRIGEALADERLVSRDALRRALEYQVQQLFHRLFQAADAWYRFREGATCRGKDGVRLDVMQLLLESARVWDEAGAWAAQENE